MNSCLKVQDLEKNGLQRRKCKGHSLDCGSSKDKIKPTAVADSWWPVYLLQQRSQLNLTQVINSGKQSRTVITEQTQITWCVQSPGHLEQHNRCRLNVVLSRVNDFHWESERAVFRPRVQQPTVGLVLPRKWQHAVGHMTLVLLLKIRITPQDKIFKMFDIMKEAFLFLFFCLKQACFWLNFLIVQRDEWMCGVTQIWMSRGLKACGGPVSGVL